jgi:RNA polymerase sigma-70 factor (ECF subfamily)
MSQLPVEPDVPRLLLQHRDELFGFILVLVRDHDLAEDLFQEAGVAILSEAARGVRPASFLKWARTIARHRIADHFRRQATRSESDVDFESLADVTEQAFDQNPLTIQLNNERLAFLRECLDRLARRARSIVDLRYQHHKSLKDIAAALSWKDDSIKVALAKIRKTLAQCVARKLEGSAPGRG